MLTVSRKLWGINIAQIYFPRERSVSMYSSADLVGITQSSVPLKGLNPIETLHKDLTKSADELFMNISKSTRKQIRQAENDPDIQVVIQTEPADEEIFRFRDFYNQLAEAKKTYPCNAFNLETLKLVRDKKALIITKTVDQQQQPLCYRVYTADGSRAMALYSASHFRQSDDNEYKRLVSKAHRLLQWEDILWFKNNGYQILDSGGLTDDPNVRNFKLEFGGEIVTEYSGYVPNTLLGRAALQARKWRLARK
ncbi:hypothetical protein MU1_07000 [Paenibacillus glycanilyticus]|uniref:BioF2-like acetyltransferase domain-containing protein n=1 Tax=Paenibacillus glycanilyticus TaxID=126569 RepID=A0ABQ6GAK9_9BACL|nr:hypothetical protein MU1_07000 [Paenibacillus glycanilyticus]